MLLNIYLFTMGVIGITMIAGGLWECLAKNNSPSSWESRDANSGRLSMRLVE